MSVTGSKTESVVGRRERIWRCTWWVGYEPSTHFRPAHMPFYEVLLLWQHLSQQLTVSWHFILAGKSNYTETNGRKKWNVNERQPWCKNELVRTQSGRAKCRDKSDLPLPALSACPALSVYSAYFPNGTVTKDSASLSSPHRAISVASCLGNIVYAPIYTREELFSLCYLQHSRGLFCG